MFGFFGNLYTVLYRTVFVKWNLRTTLTVFWIYYQIYQTIAQQIVNIKLCCRKGSTNNYNKSLIPSGKKIKTKILVNLRKKNIESNKNQHQEKSRTATSGHWQARSDRYKDILNNWKPKSRKNTRNNWKLMSRRWKLSLQEE